MSKLGLNEIIDKVQKKEINKSLAIEYIKLFIEEEEDYRIRENSVKLIGLISENHNDIYLILENVLVSDKCPFVRRAALQAILKYFPQKNIAILLEHIVKHETSPVVLYYVLKVIERDTNYDSKPIKEKLEERLETAYKMIYSEALFLLELQAYFCEQYQNPKLRDADLSDIEIGNSPYYYEKVKNRHVISLNNSR